ncbi:MAG: DUF4065 domain-containing protein [Deltaproteobacteria bacterium]|nr:DUF4065 domain-containing protein [Deltaproteobacteria bacterium]
MATAADASAFLLEIQLQLDTYKLHKLLYYAQGWHLAWYGEPLFSDRLEAWVNGPVAPGVFHETRGLREVRAVPSGDGYALTEWQQRTLREVMRVYGAFSGADLAELTHQEPPWKAARAGLPPDARSDAEVERAAMKQFFAGLAAIGEEKGRIPQGVVVGLLAWANMKTTERMDLAHQDFVDADADAYARWMNDGGDEPWPEPRA